MFIFLNINQMLCEEVIGPLVSEDMIDNMIHFSPISCIPIDQRESRLLGFLNIGVKVIMT